MLVTLASVKGSPGVTSTALALAAVWPRPVVVLEADPAGGDLAYRCRAAHGGAVYTDRGLVKLAAAVRGGVIDGDAVTGQAQELECGVSLIQGVTSAAQSRGLSGLWPTIAQACQSTSVDVIADLGRLDRTSPVMPLAEAADYVIPVGAATLESVMHLVEGLSDVAAGLAGSGVVRMLPVLVGPDAHAGRDCADLDALLGRAGLPVGQTQPLPIDARAVARLEEGDDPRGRLRRTLLLREARSIAGVIVQPEELAS